MLSWNEQRRLVESYVTYATRGLLKEAIEKSAMAPGPVEGTHDGAVLMVDIFGFSDKIRGMTTVALKAYLDQFYERVLATIDLAGGRVDRLVGDAVVALFAKKIHPLMEYNDPAKKCVEAGFKIVEACAGTNMEAKAALASGAILVCEVGKVNVYTELTMIGHPLTEVYRMESIGKANQVLATKDSNVGQAINSRPRVNVMTSTNVWEFLETKRDFKGINDLSMLVGTFKP